MEGQISSQVQGESQIAQTIGLDELPPSSQSQPSQATPDQPWGRLFPLNFLFGDNPHPLWDDVVTVGRAEDCTIVLEKTKRSSKGQVFTDTFYKAYSKVHFQLTRNHTSTGDFTFIEDRSSNGTFVNGAKLGKGTKQFLSNNDEIAICEHKNRLFVYMETIDEKENEQVPEEIERKFTIGKVLGSGAYGDVRIGFQKNSCRRVAVKIIKKDQLRGAGSQASQDTGALASRHNGLTPALQTKREIEILRAISHPCVIGIEAVADSALAFYLVLELAEGGDLHTRLKNSREPLGERLAKIYFLQIASAVDYLHHSSVTHRDLKPENILMMTLDRETVCKVTDFGLAKLASTMSSMTTFCGTPLFVAPEVIVAQGNASYTSAVDLWSLGVLLYLCLVSELPFRDGRGDMPLSQQILRGSYSFVSPRWSSISKAAKDLISQFLQVNPKSRISAGDALHAQWLDDAPAKALVDHLVHGPPPAASPPQFVSKVASCASAEARGATPTVPRKDGPSRDARSVTPTVPPDDAPSRDANDNRVVDAAVDRPIETIVAAANYSHKRRSTHLHQSSSSVESGEAGDGCGRETRSREKRIRLDP